jgi:hypothetical protein
MIVEACRPTSNPIYRHLTHGITVKEIICGKPHYVTVPLNDWHDVSANRFQVTEVVPGIRTTS